MMAKKCDSSVLDGLGTVVRTNCNLMVVCSAEPANRNDAVNVVDLADVAMAPADFTLMAFGPTGRKLQVAAKLAVPVDHAGLPTHIALVDAVTLLYVTTCSGLVVAAGGSIDIPIFNICKVDQPV
jgi:hypothetical protein